MCWSLLYVARSLLGYPFPYHTEPPCLYTSAVRSQRLSSSPPRSRPTAWGRTEPSSFLPDARSSRASSGWEPEGVGVVGEGRGRRLGGREREKGGRNFERAKRERFQLHMLSMFNPCIMSDPTHRSPLPPRHSHWRSTSNAALPVPARYPPRSPWPCRPPAIGPMTPCTLALPSPYPWWERRARRTQPRTFGDADRSR